MAELILCIKIIHNLTLLNTVTGFSKYKGLRVVKSQVISNYRNIAFTEKN